MPISAYRLSLFLQTLISMPIHNMNIKYWFISVFINVYLYRLALSSLAISSSFMRG